MTRDHGLVRCLAKGSKREKAPFSGGVEIATLGHMVALVRPNSDLVLLTSWDLLDPAYLLRQEINRYHAAMYAIDLIPRLVNDHDPHPELFDAIRSLLQELGSLEGVTRLRIAQLLVWYQWVLLGSVGSSPELRADVRGGGRVDPGQEVYGFDSINGGLTVDPGERDHPNIWRVRSETVELLRVIDENGDAGSIGHAGAQDLLRAGALLAMYIRTLVGHEIRSAHPIYPQTRPSM